MEIVNVPIGKLIPAEYNPRQLTKKQAADLEASIKRFGLVDPLIINRHKDRKNIIIGGHQRYYIAREMGLTELPCVYVKLDGAQERELNLRLNKNMGEWDWGMLAEFDTEMLLDVGFDASELDKYFNLGLEEVEEDEAPELPQDPTTKPGDLYTLGSHRLLCGDSTVVADVERLMAGAKADMVFTDPPYNVDYGANKHLSPIRLGP